VSTRARISWIFAQRGLGPDTGAGSWLLPRLIGVPRALELLYTGRFLLADEAKEIGYAHDVVAPELAFMVELGIKRDNYDALRSATIVAAGLSKLDEKLGSLATGKDADIIVMAGDPLADLKALEQIEMVFIAGKQMIGVV